MLWGNKLKGFFMGIKEKLNNLKDKNFTIDEVINILLYLVLCIMPLIIANTGRDRYYYPKAIFLWIVGSMIFLLLIKEKIKLNRTEDKIYLLFLGWLILSAIGAMDKSRVILGGNWRYEGIITLFMYGVLFIAASRYFIITKLGVRLFLSSGFVISIYYIVQRRGYEPLSFLLKNAERMNSTIGNRNFLSSYLIIVLAIAICGFIFWKSKLCFIYSLVYFAALIIGQTRGCWLALAFFCIVGMGFIIKDRKKVMRAIIIVISFGCIFMIINNKSEGVIAQRVESIKEDMVEIKASSGSGRIGIYQGAINMIIERPLLGTGVSCFWEGFKLDAPKEVLQSWEAQKTMVDKAHNEILNYAATSGLPAAILYVILNFIILKKLWRKRDNDYIKTIFIVLIGYLFQANFNISVVPVAPLYWIILGIGANIENIEKLYLGKVEKIEIS